MLTQRKLEKRLASKYHQHNISSLLQTIESLTLEFAMAQNNLVDNPSEFANQFSDICSKYIEIKKNMAAYIPQVEIDAVESAVVNACQLYHDQLSLLQVYKDVEVNLDAQAYTKIEMRRQQLKKVKTYSKQHKKEWRETVTGSAKLILCFGIGLPFTIVFGLAASIDIFATFLAKEIIRSSIASSQLNKIETEHALAGITSQLADRDNASNAALLRRGFFALTLTKALAQHSQVTGNDSVVTVDADAKLASKWEGEIHPMPMNHHQLKRELIRQERQIEKNLKETTQELLDAVQSDDLNTVVKLVKIHGNDPVIMNSAGAFSLDLLQYDAASALLIAVNKGYSGVVNALLEAPELDVNIRVDQYRSNYSLADYFYHTYNTPLTAALGKGMVNIAEELLRSKKIDVNLTSGAGQSPLMCAVRKCEKMIPALLQFEGINVNAQDSHGKSALHYACFRKNNHEELSADILALLNTHGLQLDLLDFNDGGWTPLMYAKNNGDRYMVEALLRLGANQVYTNAMKP